MTLERGNRCVGLVKSCLPVSLSDQLCQEPLSVFPLSGYREGQWLEHTESWLGTEVRKKQGKVADFSCPEDGGPDPPELMLSHTNKARQRNQKLMFPLPNGLEVH